jgi:hypothetical protein
MQRELVEGAIFVLVTQKMSKGEVGMLYGGSLDGLQDIPACLEGVIDEGGSFLRFLLVDTLDESFVIAPDSCGLWCDVEVFPEKVEEGKQRQHPICFCSVGVHGGAICWSSALY